MSLTPSGKQQPLDKQQAIGRLRRALRLSEMTNSIYNQIPTLRSLSGVYRDLGMKKESDEANARADLLSSYRSVTQTQSFNLIYEPPDSGPPKLP